MNELIPTVLTGAVLLFAGFTFFFMLFVEHRLRKIQVATERVAWLLEQPTQPPVV